MRKLAATRSRRATLLGAAIGMCAVMLTAGAGVAAARTYDDPGQGNNGDDLGGVGLVLMVPGQTVRVHVDALTGTAASVPGVDSGVALLPGQLARVTATGTASCSPSVSLATSVGCLNTDADGAAATAGSGFLAPGQPKYSLVGEVGSGPVRFVGTGPRTVGGRGELLLGYNDDFYPDNSGGFDVTIRTCTVFASVLGLNTCIFL